MNKKAFKEFEISKSKLDQVKGGKIVVSTVGTESGINPSTGKPVYEYIDSYDDGTYLRYFRAEPLPCVDKL
jgi:hypothetical protein